MQLGRWSAGAEVTQYCSTSPELGLQVEDHRGSTMFGHTIQYMEEQLVIDFT